MPDSMVHGIPPPPNSSLPLRHHQRPRRLPFNTDTTTNDDGNSWRKIGFIAAAVVAFVLMATILVYFRRALHSAGARTTNPEFRKWVSQPCKWFAIFLLAVLLSPLAVSLSPIVVLYLVIGAYKDRKKRKEQEKSNEAATAGNGVGLWDKDPERTVGLNVPLPAIVRPFPNFSK